MYFKANANNSMCMSFQLLLYGDVLTILYNNQDPFRSVNEIKNESSREIRTLS